MRLVAVVFCVWTVLSAGAGVLSVKDGPVVDGCLDDACWRDAEWEVGKFTTPVSASYRDVPDQTDFAIVADKDTVYVAIRCHERFMERLRARPFSAAVFQSNEVEVFFSPSNDSQTFYQFCVSAPAGVSYVMYHIENGATHPDPYAPFWQCKVGFEKDAWTVEMAIPLAAFYNTRAEEWSSTWVVNVARQDLEEGDRQGTDSSWSQLERGFLDPVRFKRLDGFPLRPAADDLAVNKAISTITGKKDGKLVGTLEVFTSANAATDVEFSSDHAETRKLTVPAGQGSFKVPCTFPENARYQVPLRLKRRSDGRLFGRTYPVSVDYDALAVDFVTPAYRSNFYPGQDSSKVAGRVKTTLADPVRVVLEGPGVPRKEMTVKGGETFSFETPGFASGVATLTVSCGNETRVRKIRKLVPNGRRMSWIENGHLVIDGRPTIRRTIEAPYFRTTEPLRERESVRRLHLTPEAEIVGIESGRLIRGSEQSEGVFDRLPSKEMFAAIDKRLAEYRDKDFCGWYICDEPECRAISPVYLRHIYRYVSERDPYHVCFICSRDAVRYIDACDAIEPHPYLNPRYTPDGTRVHALPLNAYGDFISCITDMNRPDKGVGLTTFAFSYHYDSPACDYATFDEYVATIWASLAEGCTMFGAFIADAIGDTAGLYHGVEYTYAQMEELERLLLLGRRTKIVRTKEYVAAKWELDGITLLAVVNFKSQSRRVTVPGLKGTYHEFRGDRTVRNVWGKDELLVYLAPYETIVLCSKKLPSRYPTLGQVRAQVEEEERVRLSRDNQLLLRDAELGFEAGGKKALFPIKLVDGVLDNCGYVPDGEMPTVAISFPNDPIEFDAVRLFGEKLDKTIVKADVGGVVKTLHPAKVERQGDSLTLKFGESQRADRVILEFHDGKAVVYELEIPFP